MSGVAFVARHPMRNVRRVFEEFLLLAAGVAQEAVGRVLFRVGAKMKDGILLQSGRDLGVDAEREDGLLLERPRDLALVALRRLYGVRVSFSRAMTHLAARDVTLARNGQLGVNRFFILSELGFVAGAAALGTRVVARRAGREVLPGNRRPARSLRQLLGR